VVVPLHFQAGYKKSKHSCAKHCTFEKKKKKIKAVFLQSFFPQVFRNVFPKMLKHQKFLPKSLFQKLKTVLFKIQKIYF